MTPASPSRREVLEAFVAANPQDAFARYGLAVEFANQGEHEAAIRHFRELIGVHPDYVTAYFQLGQLLAKLSRNDEAREVLHAGMNAAQKKGDSHARDQMQAFLEELD